MGTERDAKFSKGILPSPDPPNSVLLRTLLWLRQISTPLTRMEARLPGLRPHQWLANVFLHWETAYLQDHIDLLHLLYMTWKLRQRGCSSYMLLKIVVLQQNFSIIRSCGKSG